MDEPRNEENSRSSNRGVSVNEGVLTSTALRIHNGLSIRDRSSSDTTNSTIVDPFRVVVRQNDSSEQLFMENNVNMPPGR